MWGDAGETDLPPSHLCPILRVCKETEMNEPREADIWTQFAFCVMSTARKSSHFRFFSLASGRHTVTVKCTAPLSICCSTKEFQKLQL